MGYEALRKPERSMLVLNTQIAAVPFSNRGMTAGRNAAEQLLRHTWVERERALRAGTLTFKCHLKRTIDC